MLGRRKSSGLSQPGQTCGPWGDQLAQFVTFPVSVLKVPCPGLPGMIYHCTCGLCHLWTRHREGPVACCEDTVRTDTAWKAFSITLAPGGTRGRRPSLPSFSFLWLSGR